MPAPVPLDLRSPAAAVPSGAPAGVVELAALLGVADGDRPA